MNPSLREGEQWRVELSGAAVSTKRKKKSWLYYELELDWQKEREEDRTRSLPAAAGAYRAAALRRSGRPPLA